MLKTLADKGLVKQNKLWCETYAKRKARIEIGPKTVFGKHSCLPVGFGWNEVHEVAEQLEHIPVKNSLSG